MPRNVNDRERLIPNLEILGKLSRGDMLAAAGEDGRLVRKTNFLTQAWRRSATHDQNLFTQIKAVMDTASEQIKILDCGPDADLTKKYLQACNGLVVLLSTYRSKGSKEFAYIEQLSAVVKDHAERTEYKPQDANQEKLIDLGNRAIHYVDDCRIRSTNVYFFKHGGGHQGRYFGYTVDAVLMHLFVRYENATFRNRNNQEVAYDVVRKAVTDIMKQPVSRSAKRKQPEDKLNELLGGDGKTHSLKELLRLVPQGGRQPYISNIKREQASLQCDRLRSALMAMRMRLGNCGQKACVAATWLSENTMGRVTIARVGADGYDHNWVFISRDSKLIDALQGCTDSKRKANRTTFKDLFPRDTVVVDGWTSDCWGLRDWFNSVGNPRQLNVRRKIRKCVEEGRLMKAFEHVTWPPDDEFRNFRLCFAHIADWDWFGRTSSSVPAERRQTIVEQTLLHEAAALVSHHSIRTISEMSDVVDFEDEGYTRIMRGRY